MSNPVLEPAEKLDFRATRRSLRCLIFADGNYESLKTRNRKQPYHFRLWSGEPSALTGLYDRWNAPSGPVPYARHAEQRR